MALSKSDLEQVMSPFVTCKFQDSADERVNSSWLCLRGPLLWEDLFSLASKREDPSWKEEDGHSQEVDADRWGKILRSLGWFCERTEMKESILGSDLFSLFGIEEALTCLHREGSFRDLNPAMITRSLHVASIICVNCLLLLMGIYFQEKYPSEIVEYSVLTDERSRLSEKWKWSGDHCTRVFREWIPHLLKCSDSEEAMKLLYQWTIIPLDAVLSKGVKLQRLLGGAYVRSDHYNKINLLSKWSDELCNFLIECRKLLKCSRDTEFFHMVRMYEVFGSTAQLHTKMGNKQRTRELLVEIKSIPEVILEHNLMVPEREKGKFIYAIPRPITVLDRKIDVMTQLSSQLEDSEDADYIKEELRKCCDTRFELGYRPVFCAHLDWSATLYQQQLYTIINAFGSGRIDEARKSFEQTDLSDDQLKASLRNFLFSVDLEGLIRHSCSESTLEWETLREKQDFLLDICAALGDPQLTARCLQCCGGMMLKHSCDDKFSESLKDASKLKLMLKDELNLQLSLPAPECVQELLSCLNDPSKPEEHKRDNYPDTLKGLRLVKRSIDIYSSLLLNWTQSTSNVDEWLKLLELQKGAHNLMLSFLFCLQFYCEQYTLMICGKPLVDRINYHSVLCEGNDISVDSVISSVNSVVYKSALVWTERSRARTLLHQLGCGDGQYPDSLKAELIQFDNDQQAALSSIQSCRTVCKGDAVFVQYLCRVPLIYRAVDITFTAFRHGTMLHNVPTGCFEVEVEKLIDDYYETIEKFYKKPLPRRLEAGDVVHLHRILEKMYDILIRNFLSSPSLKRLHPNTTFVFVPDKALYRVPFALLRDKKTQKYLFQLHPIAVSPSFRVLQHCEKRARDLNTFRLKPEGCILAVGNATYENNRKLAGTGTELEHLRSCFPDRVKTLEKDEATRVKFLELVKEASHSKEQHVFACIHLGVHGHWSNIKHRNLDEGKKQYPTGSLEFSKPPYPSSKGPNINDASRVEVGRTRTSARCHTSVQMEEEFPSVTAISTTSEQQGRSFGEIGAVTRGSDFESTAAENMLPSEDIIQSGFQWRTPLVVLSACNSSRGQSYSDGEVNLPRALMIAGVPATVVTQWKIGDSASEMLMKAFYENLQCGQDVATALQSAMLHRLADSESVDQIFDWGPFLVWGLPTVQLPKELWTKNARMSLPAREKSELLRCLLTDILQDDLRVKLFKELTIVDNLLASASRNELSLGEGAIIEAIISIEELLSTLSDERHFSKYIVELAEEFYALILPMQQFKVVELELEKRSTDKFMIIFRHHIRYILAMKGRYEIALEYDRKISEVLCTSDANQTELSNHSITKAVILTLMSKYPEALREFDSFHAKFGENVEYLVQMNYLMDLMGDTTRALEYVRRVKERQCDRAVEWPRVGDFKLGYKALPSRFRHRDGDYCLDRATTLNYPEPSVSTTCKQCTPPGLGR